MGCSFTMRSCRILHTGFLGQNDDVCVIIVLTKFNFQPSLYTDETQDQRKQMSKNLGSYQGHRAAQNKLPPKFHKKEWTDQKDKEMRNVHDRFSFILKADKASSVFSMIRFYG